MEGSQIETNALQAKKPKVMGKKKSIAKAGILFTLLGASLWGFSGACSQFIFMNYEFTAYLSTLIRTLVADILFLILLLATKREQLKKIFCSAPYLKRVSVVAFGIFMTQVAFISAIDATNAGTATILQMFSNVIIIAFVCLTGKRLPKKFEIGALIFAFAAGFCVATQGDITTIVLPLDGFIWGTLNALGVAMYVVAPKYLGLYEEFDSIVVTGAGMFINTIFIVITCIILCLAGEDMAAELAGLDLSGWLALLGGVGVCGAFASYALYFHGVSLTGSVVGGLLGSAEPVSASVFAALWLGTAYTGWDWAGLVLVILVVVLVALQDAEKEKS